MEETIASTLKVLLSGGTERAVQRLRSFTKFNHLLRRRKIAQQLSSERLIKNIYIYLKCFLLLLFLIA